MHVCICICYVNVSNNRIVEAYYWTILHRDNLEISLYNINNFQFSKLGFALILILI